MVKVHKINMKWWLQFFVIDFAAHWLYVITQIICPKKGSMTLWWNGLNMVWHQTLHTLLDIKESLSHVKIPEYFPNQDMEFLFFCWQQISGWANPKDSPRITLHLLLNEGLIVPHKKLAVESCNMTIISYHSNVTVISKQEFNIV